MRKRSAKKLGFTIAETMVAMLLLGTLILLYAYTSGMLGKYTGRAAAAELIQKDELNRRLDFVLEARFRAALDLASDPLLKDCLKVPCKEDCENQIEWKPIAWKNVQLLRYKPDPLKDWIYVPGAHDINRDWIMCPPLPKPPPFENSERIPPSFPSHCRGRSIAYWRSVSSQAAEIRIQISVVGEDLSREIRYYVPFAKNADGSQCSTRAGILCVDWETYLLTIDFKTGEALCGRPDFDSGG